MKVCSVTLVWNDEATIAEALESVVSWVDTCLIIDFGSSDRSLDIAHEIAGDKLVVRRLSWLNDLAMARNAALDVASELEADWAIVLDSHEEVIVNGVGLRSRIARSTADVVSFHDLDGTLSPRLFRVPARGRWHGRCAEELEVRGGSETLAPEVVTLRAGKKSPTRVRRELQTLREAIRAEPNQPRWRFLLGELHRERGDLVEAVAAYDVIIAGEPASSKDPILLLSRLRSAGCYLQLGLVDEARARLPKDVLAPGMQATIARCAALV